MEITVKLFATLRQEAGWAKKSYDLPDGSTLGDLVAALENSDSPVRLSSRSVYAAVNQEYAGIERELSDGDVVAFFPPVSGGVATLTRPGGGSETV